ncbi:DUF3244 domain-containing protein [Gilvibacter sp.]|uniref:DUF3244 domain-containing protein n=1 Tax=Gilvibacter sp. TaxID=2729997 RepID=UPI0025C4B38F|nr:DUF3244 domain-containing protein [Gilvibacter sp.]NQX78898.1 hypothetical protein [Gilvibacter sp.]
MKFKNVIATVALMASMAATANTGNPTTNPVSIQEDSNVVRVSVLNTTLDTYKVYVYNQNGELIHKSYLGDAASIGQQFDFNDAPEGTYTFKLVNASGNTYSYSVKAGA